MGDEEQYHCRLCLLIVGIPAEAPDKSESGEQCLTKVKQMFKKLNVNVPDIVIDRARRTGNRPQMIVRFTTWRHRTLVYRAKKKPESPYKIRLDFMKKRRNTVIATNDVLQATKLGFSFADFNCRLYAKIGDKFHYFSDKEELKGLLAELNIDIEDVDSENGELEAEGQQEEEVSEEWIFELFCLVVFCQFSSTSLLSLSNSFFSFSRSKQNYSIFSFTVIYFDVSNKFQIAVIIKF